jgi:DNA-directed RNA polymerase subunit M/transcription elongation factor TFIIS
MIHRYKVHSHAETKCPNCGTILNASEEVSSDTAPGPGDLTVCNYCGVAMIFNKDMTVRMLTDGEFAVLDVETKQAIEAIASTCEYLESSRNKLPQ